MHYEEEPLAKPKTTLKEHRKLSIKAFESSRQEIGAITESALKKLGVDSQKFWKQTRFLVSHHDFGKLDTVFQMRVRTTNEKIRPINTGVPHNFISLLIFTNPQFRGLIPGDRTNIAALAAAYHHGRAERPDREAIKKQERIELKGLDDYIKFDDENKDLLPDQDILNELRCEVSSSLLIPSLLPLDKMPMAYLLDVCANSYNALLRRRWVFALMKNYLHLADWMASGTELRALVLRGGWLRVKNALAKKPTQATPLRINVQKTASMLPRRSFLVAPTGSGKTEAAVAWADKFCPRRLIFSMPTRTLVDDIYDRFNNTKYGYFPGEAGILHSTSDITRREFEDEGRESLALLDRRFHRPVMTTTFDQVLMSLYHLGRWDAVNFAIANGILVFDEVHSYDPITLGLLIELLRQTQELEVPVLMMTATLPTCIPMLISELSGQKLPEARVLPETDQPPWTVQIQEELNLSYLGSIAQGKKMLIVVNSVREAVTIYRSLKKRWPTETMLLHARFIPEDRRNILRWAKGQPNNSIESPRTLVTTQVVEVGVDLDYDILVSELCPIDTLIQRAGRINRARLKPASESPVFIYESDSQQKEISELIYGPEPLRQSKHIISDFNATPIGIQNALDKAYPEDKMRTHLDIMSKRIHRTVETCLAETLGIYNIPLQENQLPLDTRDEQYISIQAVPQQFSEQANRGNWKKYAVTIPLKGYAKANLLDLNGRFPIVQAEYNSEFGLALPEEGTSSELFII